MRSFIAIELPDSVRSALGKVQQDFRRSGMDVRWVRPENIHLTLKFLGDIEDKTAEDIVRIIKGACDRYPAFELDVSGVGVFPNTRSPRVLWVGVSENGTLTGLQKEIDEGTGSLGFQTEKRKFTPHITLGRFRSSGNRRVLADTLEQFAQSRCGTVHVTAVSLMKSDLKPSGAVYTRIAEIHLQNN